MDRLGRGYDNISQIEAQCESWGLLGGTFNPPHWGHIQVAQTAQNQAMLHRVVWVPTYRPPHRRQESLLPFNHRLSMVQAAIASYPEFHASDVERTLPAKSFAIDTLSCLNAWYPQVRWYWILGLDAFDSLPRWYQSDRLIPQCTWLIAPRFASSASASKVSLLAERTSAMERIHAQQAQWQTQGIQLHWQFLDMQPIPISSSIIRQRVCNRQPIDALVPATVKTYIQQHRLYRMSCRPND
ncbi:MAG: nicotinate (nicotinamide) nucleotide adenylyltransferase [Cyanobacteria bacterium J06638_20]